MASGDSEVTFKSGAEILAVTEHDQESGPPEHLDGQAFTVGSGDNPRESTPDEIQVHQDHSFAALSPGMAMRNRSLMQGSTKDGSQTREIWRKRGLGGVYFPFPRLRWAGKLGW